MINKEKFNELKDIIEQYDSIVIFRHIHADFDALGSQLGLKHLLLDNYSSKKVYAFGNENDYHRDFIESMDNYDEEVIKNSLVIIIDTATTSRIDGEMWDNGRYVVRIDHHPLIQEFADYILIDTDASSASQIVLELAIESKWNISPTAAKYLYAGISSDTVKLSIDKVDSRLFADLSNLTLVPFSIHEVNRAVYDVDTTEFEQETFLRSKIRFSGDFAYLLVSLEELDNLNISVERAKEMVDMMGNIKGITKYATIVQKDGHFYAVSLRSHGPVISDIAMKYGGGGHLLASGISNLPTDKLKELIELMTERR